MRIGGVIEVNHLCVLLNSKLEMFFVIEINQIKIKFLVSFPYILNIFEHVGI